MNDAEIESMLLEDDIEECKWFEFRDWR